MFGGLSPSASEARASIFRKAAATIGVLTQSNAGACTASLVTKRSCGHAWPQEPTPIILPTPACRFWKCGTVFWVHNPQENDWTHLRVLCDKKTIHLRQSAAAVHTISGRSVGSAGNLPHRRGRDPFASSHLSGPSAGVHPQSSSPDLFGFLVGQAARVPLSGNRSAATRITSLAALAA